MALNIVSHTPKDGEEVVSLDQTIKIEFTDDLDSNTINEKTMVVYEDNIPINGSVSYLARQKTATFKPSSDFKPNTKYTVVLSGRIQSITGDSLSGEIVFKFTTQEDSYKLNKPKILYPSDNATVNKSVIKWSEDEFAENYSIEVSDRPDFKNLVFSTIVVNDTEINADLDSGKEYYVRVKSKDILANDPDDSRLMFNTDDLDYQGRDYFEFSVDPKYLPLYSLKRVYIEDHGELRLEDQGRSKEGDCYIKSPSKGTISINYPLKKSKDVYIDFEYLPSKKNSEWSETVSFYYDKTEIDFEQLVETLDTQERFLEINQQFEISVETDYIYFKLYYGYLDVDDVEVEIEGLAVNESPYLEAHGVLDKEKTTGIALTNDKLNKLDSERFEYQISNDYTPLISIERVVDNNTGEDITEKAEIVDKKQGIISINHDLSKGINLSVKYSPLQVTERTDRYTVMRYEV